MTSGSALRALLPTLVAAMLFVCVGFGPLSVHAASNVNVLEMHTDDGGDIAWQLTADKVTSHNESKVVEAEGHVVLRHGSEYLKADYARYYSSTNWIYLKGNVDVLMGKDNVLATEAEFDLRSKTGWMKNGQIFMAGPHIYFAGERVDKTWGDNYTFQKAKITACDGDVPAWSLEAEQAIVEIDGYAQLFRSTFNVMDKGVGYTPLMILPAKKTRQSGFLRPSYGVSSSRGAYFNLPYYWVIDESRDLTVNEYWMEKRGVMQGAEYRSHPALDTMTWMRLDWLYDGRRVTDDRNDPVISGDSLVRSNAERYWLRGMADGRLGDPKWRYKVDLDYVSDQNFLREFGSGMGGYARTRDTLFDLYGRDIRERENNRISQGMIYRDWDRVTFTVGARYEQNPALGNGNTTYSADTTVQRLPEANVYLHKGKLAETLPLEIEASAQTVYMHRNNGTQGARHDVQPRISLPWNTRYGSVISSLALRHTIYNTELEKRMSEGEETQDGTNRTLPTVDVQAFTEVDNVWKLDGDNMLVTEENAGKTEWTAMRHAVQPRMEYRSVPFVEQGRNPRYDSEDRIAPRNELVYSVTNVLTRRASTVVMQDREEGEGKEAVRKESYLDVVRWRLENGYDIRESTRSEELDTYERRPFTDILSELEFYPVDKYGYTGRTYWSPYLNEVTRHDHGITMRDAKWGTFSTGLSFRRELDEYRRVRDRDLQLIYNQALINLGGPWSVATRVFTDLENGSSYERSLDVIYTEQCYKIIGRYSYDRWDEGFEILVELPGLGGE